MKNILFAFLLFAATGAVAQPKIVQDSMQANKSTLNKTDHKGRKNGLWLFHLNGSLGEYAYYQFGHYDHGRKTGIWYKVDANGDMMAAEQYKNNALDGEVKYYEEGKLYCVGHYRGLNPDNEFDTIYVEHPITGEMIKRIVSTDRGTLRHGMWRYYDPETGKLLREEEYQVDDLIYRKNFNNASADSTYTAQRLQMVQKRVKSQVQLGKSVNYTSGE